MHGANTSSRGWQAGYRNGQLDAVQTAMYAFLRDHGGTPPSAVQELLLAMAAACDDMTDSGASKRQRVAYARVAEDLRTFAADLGSMP